MKTVCAWCGKRIGWKPGKGTSHGICRRCKKKWLAGLKTQKARRVFARACHEVKLFIKFCQLSPADVRAAIDAAHERPATWAASAAEVARI